MADNHKHDHDPGRSSVATFPSRAEAREAIAALHKAHYTHTWLGVTSVAAADGGDETLTVESQQMGGFFSGTNSLVDALVSHGVLGDTAREIERTIQPGDALVTVDPKDKEPNDAVMILEQHGGHVAGRSPQTNVTAGAVRTSSASVQPIGDDDEETFYHRPLRSR